MRLHRLVGPFAVRPRLAVVALVALAALALPAVHAGFAQVVNKANWIWFDEGNPIREAPSGTVYFRKTFEENYELQEAELHITCDNAFVLFVNGKEIGRGNDWKDGKVFNVKDHLVRGKNVIAVRATNEGGPAGMVAWLVRLTKPGNHYTVATDGTWKCSKDAADGWREIQFDDSKWSSPKVLSELARPDRWPGITWNGKQDVSRFSVPDGFAIEQVADPEVTGSIVNMTFDWKGRPVVTRERGAVYILLDENNDGKFEKAHEYTDRVKNCQGILCYDRETYYVVGDGPDGTALYRLKDNDGDDRADTCETLHKFKGGMGEHGPHAIITGPDGYLYFNSGNHAWVQAEPEPGSPCPPFIHLGHLQKQPGAKVKALKQQSEGEVDREVQMSGGRLPLRDVLRAYEADVLPRYEDAGGHAVGIRVPGGTIWRLDPDAKHWSLEACGFRNHYDIAFNSLGELFSFDSDMEWDEHAPWYRPVRVNHCPPGADFGWRSGANKWPEYYVDSLPGIVDTGRGSPCGVIVYNHTAFPEKYHDALFITDWSYGRIFAVHMKRAGATFQAEAEEFVTGKPLNVTDVEVAPDGSLFFTTGGRNTEGGVYRIRATNPAKSDRSDATGIAAILNEPQPQSAFARENIRRAKAELGDDWGRRLEESVVNSNAATNTRIRALSYLMQFGPAPSVELAKKLAKDKDTELRSQAAMLFAKHTDAAQNLTPLLDDSAPIVQRRAIEALIRTRSTIPLEKLRPLLAHEDRFLRYAARLALERIDPAAWSENVIADKNPRVAIMGIIALNRNGVVATDTAAAEKVLAKIHVLLQAKLPPGDEVDALRALELAYVNCSDQLEGETPAKSLKQQFDSIGKLLLARYPASTQPLDRELSRMIAALEVPGGIAKLLAKLEEIGSTDSLEQRADAVHLARCLVAIEDGWTWAERQRFLAWFDTSREWKGGHSYAGYITNFLRDSVKQLNEQELLAVLNDYGKMRRASLRVLAPDERINDKAASDFVPALAKLLGDQTGVPTADVLLALGRTGRTEAEALLLERYEATSGELRDTIVRALTNFQNTRNWPIFVRALDSENKDTVRAAAQALAAIEQKPDGPAAYRAAIQATSRLGDQGGWDTIVLLRQWAGRHFGAKKPQWKPELEKWQSWYAENYPDAPTATLAKTEKTKHNWTYDQLLAYLESDGRNGSVDAGRTLFEKAVCAKCHKLENVGTGLGPDLTTLASRFKRKDILEAIVYPSRVISDQYKSVLIATKDGRVLTAMRAPDDGDQLVLLLSDASTLKLPKSEVDEMVEGKQSVMPDGLLNDLSLREIADLFAFLESGKGEPASGGASK